MQRGVSWRSNLRLFSEEEEEEEEGEEGSRGLTVYKVRVSQSSTVLTKGKNVDFF